MQMLCLDSKVVYRDIEAAIILQPIVIALNDAGIAGAVTDARCLLGLVLGRDDQILPHESVPLWNQEKSCQLGILLQRRCRGEPISRLRGWREFWSMRFELSPSTLDPRPDSESLVEAVVGWGRRFHSAGLSFLDLGTGSGCLLLACLSEFPNATGIGMDINLDAIAVAVSNAARLGLTDRAHFYHQDFSADLTAYGHFDLIMANPPYIPSSDIDKLERDVRHFDPIKALDGGSDGLASWRVLLPRLPAILKNDGNVFVEVGAGQCDLVCDLAVASQLTLVATYKDLAGHERCLQFQKEK